MPHLLRCLPGFGETSTVATIDQGETGALNQVSLGTKMSRLMNRWGTR